MAVKKGCRDDVVYLPKIRRYDEDTWPGSIEGVDRRSEGSFEGAMAEPSEGAEQMASPGGTLYGPR